MRKANNEAVWSWDYNDGNAFKWPYGRNPSKFSSKKEVEK